MSTHKVCDAVRLKCDPQNRPPLPRGSNVGENCPYRWQHSCPDSDSRHRDPGKSLPGKCPPVSSFADNLSVLVASRTMQSLRNTGDRILALGRVKVLRKALTAVGVQLPVDLERGTSRWFEQPLLLRHSCDVRSLGGGAVLQTLLQKGTEGQAAQAANAAQAAVVVDCTGPTTLDPRELFTALRGTLSEGFRRTTVVFRAGSDTPSHAAAAATGGLIRSLAKEVGGRGYTVNGVCVHGTPVPRSVEHAAAYLSLPEAAFVTGQVVHVGREGSDRGAVLASGVNSRAACLSGRIAVVTGAARGIGAAIARRLAREGATIVGIDIPSAEEPLRVVMASVAGIAVPLDIAAPGAAGRAVAALRHAGVSRTHVVVHNAGITRDKTLRRMKDAAVDAVLRVNLEAPLALTSALTDAGLLGGPGASAEDSDRVICVSSISGIGGAFGQTNYSYSKAGLIG